MRFALHICSHDSAHCRAHRHQGIVGSALHAWPVQNAGQYLPGHVPSDRASSHFSIQSIGHSDNAARLYASHSSLSLALLLLALVILVVPGVAGASLVGRREPHVDLGRLDVIGGYDDLVHDVTTRTRCLVRLKRWLRSCTRSLTDATGPLQDRPSRRCCAMRLPYVQRLHSAA